MTPIFRTSSPIGTETSASRFLSQNVPFLQGRVQVRAPGTFIWPQPATFPTPTFQRILFALFRLPSPLMHNYCPETLFTCPLGTIREYVDVGSDEQSLRTLFYPSIPGLSLALARYCPARAARHTSRVPALWLNPPRDPVLSHHNPSGVLFSPLHIPSPVHFRAAGDPHGDQLVLHDRGSRQDALVLQGL